MFVEHCAEENHDHHHEHSPERHQDLLALRIVVTFPHKIILTNHHYNTHTSLLPPGDPGFIPFAAFSKGIPYECGLVYNLKMERREEENENQLEEESSGLDYLVNNAPQEEQDSNEPKKKPRNESEKESQVRRVLINNLSKEKKAEGESQHDGVYLYKPGVQLPSLYQFANQTVKIIIASEYIKRYNPQLLRRSIFGADPYTSNSDAVCMLVHSGSVNINTFQGKRYEGVELTCKVIKPKKNYSGCFKNGLLSRSLKGYNGNALKPEAVRNLTSLGPMELLERYAANMHIPIGKSRVRPRSRNIATIIPVPETHIVFNMNNEPAYKYSIFNIADKGFDRSEFMIKKLDNFVLYLETDDHQKYELLKNLEMDVFDIFRFSRVKHPERIDNEFFEQHGCPLDDGLIEVLFPSLEWDEILWGNSSVFLHGELRVEGLRSFKYYKRAAK